MSSIPGAGDTRTNGAAGHQFSSEHPSETAAFDRLIDDYRAVWSRVHPVASVDIGIYDYADRLRPYADDDHAVLVSLNERLLKGLDEIDSDVLDADRALDYQLAVGGAYLELDALQRHDWRHRDPQRFVPIDAIYQLLVRPVPNRIAALSARLKELPDYLRSAKVMLQQFAPQVSPDWLENALLSLDSGRHFLAVASEHPQVLQSLGDDPRLGDQESHRLMFLLADANDALLAFQEFLQESIAPNAQGDYACGEDRFNALLRYRHSLSIDAAALRQFGEKVVRDTRAELKLVSARLSGGETMLALAERLRGDVIAESGLLPAYRQAVDSARRFVVDKGLASVPDETALQIELTPHHLRYFVPFSDYIAPPPQDPIASAMYLITPLEDEQAMIGHDHRRIRHLAINNTWPGKHLQALFTNQRSAAHSFARVLNCSSTNTRGWAMYSEELMVTEGFVSGPEDEFLLLYHRLWHALGLIADIDLHTKARTVAQVEDELRAELGFSSAQAKAEVARYIRQPAVTMGYVCGAAQIRAARDILSKSQASQLDLKQFHDDYLQSGPVAVSLALAQAFGADLRERVDQQLFNV